MEEKTPVKVLFVKSLDEVVAVMPEELGTMDSLTMTCYSHIGQHSSCHDFWVHEQKKANESEYAPLLKELESIGYEVTILKRYDSMSVLRRSRKISEIK